MSRVFRRLASLKAATSGVAMTEFALVAPLLMVAGLYGAETTWLTITHMRINQAALKLADDASRIGDISTLEDRKIYESDVNDLLFGSHLESGTLDIMANGRVIISSLEVVPDSNPEQQYIHWQRCKGRLNWQSSYGNQGDGLSGGGFNGMGPAGNKITAIPDDAVMFVEVAYNYQPLLASMFVPNRLIQAYAAFNVRDDRDLTQLYQRSAINPDPVSMCSAYSDFTGSSALVAPAGTPSTGTGSSSSTTSGSTTSGSTTSGSSSSTTTSGGTSSGASTGGASSGGATSSGASSSGASSSGATSSGATSSGAPGV